PSPNTQFNHCFRGHQVTRHRAARASTVVTNGTKIPLDSERNFLGGQQTDRLPLVRGTNLSRQRTFAIHEALEELGSCPTCPGSHHACRALSTKSQSRAFGILSNQGEPPP